MESLSKGQYGACDGPPPVPLPSRNEWGRRATHQFLTPNTDMISGRPLFLLNPEAKSPRFPRMLQPDSNLSLISMNINCVESKTERAAPLTELIQPTIERIRAGTDEIKYK